MPVTPEHSIPVFLRLTPAQQKIAVLLTEGHSNKEIAGRLGIAPKTISSQLYGTMETAGLRGIFQRVPEANRSRVKLALLIHDEAQSCQ
jgi:DNA-binding NarL/FixJ family response regulator